MQEFLKFAKKYVDSSYSQNIQDLWGLWENRGKLEGGYFVEFGALGGINVSNSYLMECMGWQGIVAEPHPMYKSKIEENRACNKSYDAVYSESGMELVFKIFRGSPARSTLKEFEREDDKFENKLNFKEVIVKTISLNDLLDQNNAPDIIDYISIDTEGSEFEILKNLNFSKYKFRAICVEYGDDEIRQNLYDLLKINGYSRKWEAVSDHDDWYTKDEFDYDYSSDIKEFETKLRALKHEVNERAKKRNRLKITKLLS